VRNCTLEKSTAATLRAKSDPQWRRDMVGDAGPDEMHWDHCTGRQRWHNWCEYVIWCRRGPGTPADTQNMEPCASASEPRGGEDERNNQLAGLALIVTLARRLSTPLTVAHVIAGTCSILPPSLNQGSYAGDWQGRWIATLRPSCRPQDVQTSWPSRRSPVVLTAGRSRQQSKSELPTRQQKPARSRRSPFDAWAQDSPASRIFLELQWDRTPAFGRVRR
jgi:hypothetical protein